MVKAQESNWIHTRALYFTRTGKRGGHAIFRNLCFATL